MRKAHIKKKVFYMLIASTLIAVWSCSNDKSKSNFLKDNLTITQEPEEDLWVKKINRTIYLDTNNGVVLGKIIDVKFSKNEIYILDEYYRKIYVFNLEGQNVRTLFKIGKGKGEYIKIRHFDIKDDKIYVLVEGAKVLKYDCNNFDYLGNLEFDEKVWPYKYGSMATNDTNFVLSRYHLTEQEKGICFYTSVRQKLHFEHEACDINVNNRFERGGIVQMHQNILKNNYPEKNTYLYNYSFSNNLFKISKNTVIANYKIDFGDYSIPEDILAQNFEKISEYTSQNRTRIISSYVGYNNFILLEIIDSKYPENIISLVNTKKGTTKTYNAVKHNELDCTIQPINSYNEGFIGIIDSETIINTLSKIKNKRKTRSDISGQEQLFAKKFRLDSNPAIVLFNLGN